MLGMKVAIQKCKKSRELLMQKKAACLSRLMQTV